MFLLLGITCDLFLFFYFCFILWDLFILCFISIFADIIESVILCKM